MNQTWENDEKLVSGPILIHLAQIRAAKTFFSKNLASSVTGYHGQLSSCTKSEKTNDPIRKLSNGRTRGRTDKREWFHRTLPINVKRSQDITRYRVYCLISSHKMSLVDFWIFSKSFFIFFLKNDCYPFKFVLEISKAYTNIWTLYLEFFEVT